MRRISSMVFIMTIASFTTLHGQSVRTTVVGAVSVDAAIPEGVTVALRYNEAVGITFPENPRFIQGIEFELRIPKEFKNAESSVAWTLYRMVAPVPSGDEVEYTVDSITSQPLPARVSMNIILPVVDKHGLKGGPYASLIPSVAGKGRFPLLFKLSPIGKGLLPSMEDAEFRLTVRPVIGDEGGIRLDVATPEGPLASPPSVYVDDRLVEPVDGFFTARRGARVIRISRDGYKEEIVTVAVEPGRVFPVSVTLTPNAPVVRFHAPEGTVITLDGQQVNPADWDGLTMEPGEHSISLVIGDYSLTRKLVAARGKTYSIVMTVELTIEASP